MGLGRGVEGAHVGAFGLLNNFHSVDLFEFALGHGCFGGFVAEAVGQGLQTLFFGYVGVVVFLLFLVFGLFYLGEFGVVAGIAFDFGAFDFVDNIYEFVQKGAVVRDHDNGLFVVG